VFRVGQNHTCVGIYGVHTLFLAGKSPYIRSYAVCIYGSGQPYRLCCNCLQSVAAELEVLVVTKQHNALLQQSNDALKQQLTEYGKQFQSIQAAITKSNKVTHEACV